VYQPEEGGSPVNMSFALPIAFWLTLVALPIIGLYILKVRLRRIPVSTNMFWKQMFDEKPPRAWWQTLRHLFSLLAQLLILFLLVAALADPFMSWQTSQARRLVLIVDSSASMLATDLSPSRFEAARSAAQKVLDGVRQRDEVAIVSTGNPPQVVLGMGSHIPTMRNAVQSLQPNHAASPLEPAIRLAKQLIGDRPNGHILIFTDGRADDQQNARDVDQLEASPLAYELAVESVVPQNVEPPAAESSTSDADPSTPSDSTEPEIKIETIALASSDPKAQANVGITQFQVRRSLVDPLGYEILVGVLNASDQSRRCRLELELDGVPVDVLPLNLEAEQQWFRTLAKTSLEGGTLQATLTEIEGINALTVDDRAWSVVPQQVVQKVLIVSPGNLFVQKVFEANPLAQVSVTRELPTMWPTDSLIVLHRLIPEQLPPTNLLVLDPETNCDLWDLGDTMTTPILTELDKTSPLMTHVRLDNVQIPEARQLRFKVPIHPLASTLEGHAVIATAERTNEKKCLVLSANLEKSDLAFRTVFPIWVANALNWYAGRSGELQLAVSAGQLVTGPGESLRSEGAKRHRLLLGPDGSISPVAGQAIGPFDQVGVWSVVPFATEASAEQAQRASGVKSSGGMRGSGGVRSSGGDKPNPAGSIGIAFDESANQLLELAEGDVQRIAVNLSSASESDLRPKIALSDNRQQAGSLLAGWLSYPLWFYLVLLVGGLSVVEWILYQRRVIT
jgi:hypothetical protein